MGASHGNPPTTEDVPEESYFVVENRANIPLARGPLVNTSGRALGATGSTKGKGEQGALQGQGDVAQEQGEALRPEEKDHMWKNTFQSTQGAPKD